MIRFQQQSSTRYVVSETTVMNNGAVNIFNLYCDTLKDAHKALTDNWYIWQNAAKNYGTAQVHLACCNSHKPYNVPASAIVNQSRRAIGKYLVAVSNFANGHAELTVKKI